MRPGHRASGPDPGNEILASSSGNQCRSSAQLSSAQRSAALGKARPWPSFFSVCICFTEALGLAIGVGLVYIAYRRTYAFQLQLKLHGSHLPHRFRRLPHSHRSCGFIPRGWPCRIGPPTRTTKSPVSGFMHLVVPTHFSNHRRKHLSPPCAVRVGIIR